MVVNNQLLLYQLTGCYVGDGDVPDAVAWSASDPSPPVHPQLLPLRLTPHSEVSHDRRVLKR